MTTHRTRLAALTAATLVWSASVAVPGAHAAPAADPAAAAPSTVAPATVAPSTVAPAAGAPFPGAIAYPTLQYSPYQTGITVRDSRGNNPSSQPTASLLYDVEYDGEGQRVALLSARGLAIGPADLSTIPDPPATPVVTGLGQVEWAPGSTTTLYGGSNVVYQETTSAAVWRLAVAADGSVSPTRLVTLADPYAYRVLPSPDGSTLLVSSTNLDLVTHHYLLSLADNGLRPVPLPAGATDPAWNTDGTEIVFSTSSLSDSKAVVHRLAADTLTDLGVLAELPEQDVYLLGEDDGLGRVYAQGRGSQRLYLVDTMTGAVTTGGVLGERQTRIGDLTVAPGGVDLTGSCQGRVPTIVGTEGDDHIVGTAGDDVIFGKGGDDTIDGLGGDDVLCGNEGDDTISGGPGDDRIHGDTGDDTLAGDEGDDLIGGWAGDDVISGGGGRDQIAAGDGDDTVTGGVGGDSIRGGPGADTIDSGDGDDTVLPGPTSTRPDRVTTGAGDDFVLVGRTTAIVSTGDGDDEVAANGEASRGRAVSTLDLGDGDDTAAVPGADVVAGAGDDTVYSAATADLGDGDDNGIRSRRAYSAATRYEGGPGNDYLAGAMVMRGNGGDDRIEASVYSRADGGPGDDTIVNARPGSADLPGPFPGVFDGGPGDDVLEGGPTMYGADGNDTLRHATTAFGGPGDDTIEGRRLADVLDGGPGDDTIVGKEGDDVLRGGAGLDKLNGGAGDDTLDGGPGRDLCHTGDSVPQVSCEVTYPRG